MRQLTAEEEDDIAEWLTDNPCIYKKKLELYCQNDMKKRLWIEKAHELANIDVEYIKIFQDTFCEAIQTAHWVRCLAADPKRCGDTPQI